MALFNWFGSEEHRVFNYKPRYYDPEKEERRKLFGDVDGTAGKNDGRNYSPGSYLHGAFRDGNYARRRGGNRAQAIIGIIGLVLLVAIFFYLTKFYSLL